MQYSVQQHVFLYVTHMKYDLLYSVSENFAMKEFPAEKQFSLVNKIRSTGLWIDKKKTKKHNLWVLTEKLDATGARLENTTENHSNIWLKRLKCQSLVQEGLLYLCFLTKQSIAKISTCRKDGICNTSCELWIVTNSFRMLSAFRHADSSAKYVCASQQAAHWLPWSAEPWTQPTH
jgi:hypothetical protein